jgi:hypothetical protein
MREDTWRKGNQSPRNTTCNLNKSRYARKDLGRFLTIEGSKENESDQAICAYPGNAQHTRQNPTGNPRDHRPVVVSKDGQYNTADD